MSAGLSFIHEFNQVYLCAENTLKKCATPLPKSSTRVDGRIRRSQSASVYSWVAKATLSVRTAFWEMKFKVQLHVN